MPDDNADLSSPGDSAPPGPEAGARRLLERLTDAESLELLASSGLGRLVYNGTIEKGQPALPFGNGKYFWLEVSSPENLRILVGGKPFPLSGLKPVTLTVTPGGVQSH